MKQQQQLQLASRHAEQAEQTAYQPYKHSQHAVLKAGNMLNTLQIESDSPGKKAEVHPRGKGTQIVSDACKAQTLLGHRARGGFVRGREREHACSMLSCS